jgi:MFS family permease
MSRRQAGSSARLAETLVTAASSMLPYETRERYRQEWLAELQQYQHEGIPLAAPALRILRTAPATRHAMRRTLRGVVNFPVWRTLALPRYRWYFASSVCADTGVWTRNTALIILVYTLTHSMYFVGVVMSAQFTGALILGPWLAFVATRIGYYRSLLGARCAVVVIEWILACLALVGNIDLFWILMGATLIGNASALAMPAASEVTVHLVPPQRAMMADEANSLSFNIAQALAPLPALVLIVSAGYASAFTLDAVGSMFTCIVLLGLRPRTLKTDHFLTLSRVRPRWSFVWRDRSVLILLAVAATVTAAASPALVLGPALALAVRAPVTSCAYFLAALGAGAVLVSFRPVRRPGLGKIPCLLLMLSASAVVLAVSPAIWLSLCAAAVMGSASALASTTAKALLAHHCRREQTSTVAAVWATAFVGAGSITSILDGLFTEFFGISVACMLIAAPSVIVAAFLIVKPSRFRREILSDEHAMATSG